MIFDWDKHRNDIIKRLEKPADLKICTKNLDEPELIESWIVHHGGIVGLDNLIIADNDSTHPETLRIYQKYCDTSTIFRFTGAFDEIHGYPRFASLYEAIRRYTKLFAMFDTDERLILVEDDRWIADHSIVKRLVSTGFHQIIPTTWLINLFDRTDRFHFRDTEGSDKFTNNLVWGKPIIPGPLVGTQFGIHNVQFRKTPISTRHGLNCFLLHLTQLPDRRLAVNREKLVKLGVVAPGTSFEKIAQLTRLDYDSTTMRFISETKTMLSAKSSLPVSAGDEYENFLELKPGGEVTYSSNDARR